MSKGIISQQSKVRFLQIIQKLIENGAEGILLGCTEIPLLISQKDISIPVFDTAFYMQKLLYNSLDNR